MANPKRKGRASLRISNTRNHQRFNRLATLRYSSLSDVEDKEDKQFFIEIARSAAKNAINENIALNIPIVVAEDGWVVKKSNDGTVERISRIEQKASDVNKMIFTKGTVLHVKKR